MRKHPHLGGTRHAGQPCDRSRHFVAARHDARDQPIEFLAGKAAALHHSRALLRLVETGDGGIHVVVEREQVDAPVRQPLRDFGFGIEVVGLVAQVKAGVRRQLRPQRLDRLEQLPCTISAAKPGLPGPGGGVKDRGDAVANGLPVAVGQRHVDGKADAGTRHHLPLECVTMQVDDSRQHLEVAGIDDK